ncbi:hypothetical protein Q7P35_000629 [Cladosporium inversicolor]
MISKDIDATLVAQTRDRRQQEPAYHFTVLFDRIARSQPDSVAVTALQETGVSGRRSRQWTYSELQLCSMWLAYRLSKMGLPAGSRIAAFMFNEMEWSLLFLATIRAGYVFVPLDPRLLEAASDASFLLQKIKCQAVFVSDKNMASAIDDLLHRDTDTSWPSVKIIVSPEHDGIDQDKSWHSLTSIMDSCLDPENISQADYDIWKRNLPTLDQGDIILMLTTSGTTSRPKICPHSSITIATPALALKDHLCLGPADSLCQHLPTSHIFSVALSLAFWVSGGTVIVPSVKFDPSTTFAGLAAAPRVWMAAVPAIIHALSTHMSIMGEESQLASPHGVVLGGGPVTMQALQYTRDLGARCIVAGYGTTEGVATLFNIMEATDPYIDGESTQDVCLGPAASGTHLKICKYGSRIPIERNQIGELHQGGLPVIDGYFEGTESQNEAFYREDGITWSVTGDRGYMDDYENIFLLGRYKDLIIRSGENISPLKIEQCLMKQHDISGAVVIGVPDEIAGEIPVAVVNMSQHLADNTKIDTQKLQSAVTQALGKSFSPNMILQLSDLGHNGFPCTTSGKVKKDVVRAWVVTHLAQLPSQEYETPSSCRNERVEMRQRRQGDEHESRLVDHLKMLWSSVSGLSSQQLDPEASIRHFADSTMLIQFVAKARSEGLKITLKQLLAADTINNQASLLAGTAPPRKAQAPAAPNLPSPSMNTSDGSGKTAASTVVNWPGSNIECFIPMTDTFKMIADDERYPGAWTMRLAIMIRRTMTAENAVAVVETWLRKHPILRSAIARIGSEPFAFAVMDPVKSWTDRQLILGPKIDGAAALKAYNENDFVDTKSASLCKITVLPLSIEGRQELPKCGLVIQMHHAIYDGASAERWLRDLNDLIDSSDRLPSSPLSWSSYYQFAVDYAQHRQSEEARQSVVYFVEKMSGIAAVRNSIWDIRSVIDKMESSQTGNHARPDVSTAPLCSASTTPPHTDLADLARGSVALPYLAQMRSRFGISPVVVALAACAIINVRHTGGQEAIFTNLQSGRSWSTGDDNSSLFDVDGPTMTAVPSRISVRMQGDTARDLLLRVRNEQDQTMLHAQVPMARVLDSLQRDDAMVLRKLITGQMFNWLLEPYRETGDAPLQVLRRTSLSPSEWVWYPMLQRDDERGVTMMHLSVYHGMTKGVLLPDKKQELVGEFLGYVAWLADPENMEKGLEECF